MKPKWHFRSTITVELLVKSGYEKHVDRRLKWILSQFGLIVPILVINLCWIQSSSKISVRNRKECVEFLDTVQVVMEVTIDGGRGSSNPKGVVR